MRNGVDRKIYMKTEKIVYGARFMADTSITESPQLLLSIDSVRALFGYATNQAINMETT